MSTVAGSHGNHITSVDSAEPVQVVSNDQVPAVNYEWGAIKWLSDMKITPGSQQSIGYAYVLPDKTNPDIGI